MYYLEQSCRIQISAQSTGAPLSMPSEAVLEHGRGVGCRLPHAINPRRNLSLHSNAEEAS